MTSDERNRKLKYGHEVPRWWIPEFNLTHRRAEAGGSQRLGIQVKMDPERRREHFELKRRERLVMQRLKVKRVNKDIKIIQKALAVIVVLIGALTGGLLGCGMGLVLALLLISFRLEL